MRRPTAAVTGNRLKLIALFLAGLCLCGFGCADGDKDKPFWELGDYYTDRTAMDSPNMDRHFYPVHQALNIHPETSIHISFDHVMNRFSVHQALHMSPEVSGTCSWDTRSFTFTPDERLSENTTYEVTIDTGARDIYDMPLYGPVSWWFTTGSLVSELSSSNPAQGATKVPVTTNISLTFNRPMQHYSLERFFEIFPVVQGTFYWTEADTVVFLPSQPLKYYTEYEVRVRKGARDLVGGILQNDVTVTFWTERAPVTTIPRISSISPQMDEQHVDVKRTITVIMDKTIDAATITTDTVKLFKGTSEEVQIAPGLSEDALTITAVPGTALDYDTKYTCRLSGAITDQEGHGFDGDRDGTSEGTPDDDYFWNFSTERDRDPPVPTQAQALNSKLVRLEFNEALEAGADDLDRVAYGFMNDYHRVLECEFTPLDNFVLLTLSAPLTHGNNYAITVTGFLRDTARNKIEPGNSTSFTGTGMGWETGYESTNFILNKIDAPSEKVRLSTLRGQPVAVHFFTVFSPASSSALTAFDTVQPDYQDRVHFVGISLEGISPQQLPADMSGGSIMLNSGRSVADTLHMTPVPGTMILDRYGVIRWRMAGSFDETEFREKMTEVSNEAAQ